MALPTWLRSLRTRLQANQLRRTGRPPASPRPVTVWLGMELLEDRLALSGFGPEDGAYIVEDRGPMSPGWQASTSASPIFPGTC